MTHAHQVAAGVKPTVTGAGSDRAVRLRVWRALGALGAAFCLGWVCHCAWPVF